MRAERKTAQFTCRVERTLLRLQYVLFPDLVGETRYLLLIIKCQLDEISILEMRKVHLVRKYIQSNPFGGIVYTQTHLRKKYVYDKNNKFLVSTRN